jgi:hypothetical protein
MFWLLSVLSRAPINKDMASRNGEKGRRAKARVKRKKPLNSTSLSP